MNYLLGTCPLIDSSVYFKENKYSSLSLWKILAKTPNILHVCFFPEYPSPPFLKTIFTKSSLQELIGNQQRFSMHTFRLEEETCSPWEEMTSLCTESTFETDTCKSKLDSPARSTGLISHKNNFRKEIQFCSLAVMNLLLTFLFIVLYCYPFIVLCFRGKGGLISDLKGYLISFQLKACPKTLSE